MPSHTDDATPAPETVLALFEQRYPDLMTTLLGRYDRVLGDLGAGQYVTAKDLLHAVIQELGEGDPGFWNHAWCQDGLWRMCNAALDFRRMLRKRAGAAEAPAQASGDLEELPTVRLSRLPEDAPAGSQ